MQAVAELTCPVDGGRQFVADPSLLVLIRRVLQEAETSVLSR